MVDAAETVTVPIEYWTGPNSIQGRDESFWTKEAMERAVGAYWYRVHQQSHGRDVPMPTISLSVDRKRGVVVVTPVPSSEQTEEEVQ